MDLREPPAGMLSFCLCVWQEYYVPLCTSTYLFSSVSLAQLTAHVEELRTSVCPPSMVITFVLMSQMLHMKLTMFAKRVLSSHDGKYQNCITWLLNQDAVTQDI